MADSKPPVPSLDVVLAWVTNTIESDYIERNAFPHLRAARAVDRDSNSFLHYLDEAAAQQVLVDARAQYASQTKRKGLKVSYGAFIRSLEEAVKKAKARRAIFEASAPVCTYKGEYFQDWRGSKEQLKAMGVNLAGPWPGEAGGKERRAKAYDNKGRTVYVSPYSRTWPGLYEARIEIPEREREQAKNAEERAKKRARAEANLDCMPRDADEYRMKLVENVRRWLSIEIKAEQVDWHGYALSEDAVDDILMSCDAVVEAILQAEVNFDEKRHRQIELKHRQQIAEGDESFQHVLGNLATVRPEILEGSAS